MIVKKLTTSSLIKTKKFIGEENKELESKKNVIADKAASKETII